MCSACTCAWPIATRCIVTLDDLGRMKPTVLSSNTSRAELVVDGALAGPEPRPPGYIAVDVFDSEPILQGHPLLRLENAVCTPHIGYVEQDNYEMILMRRSRTSSPSSATTHPTSSIRKRLRVIR